MTESKKQEISAKLIELGFWEANEEGDPTTDRHAASALLRKIQRRVPEKCRRGK
jgi:hypothetical protein